jgi:hypothetical protein
MPWTERQYRYFHAAAARGEKWAQKILAKAKAEGNPTRKK